MSHEENLEQFIQRNDHFTKKLEALINSGFKSNVNDLPSFIIQSLINDSPVFIKEIKLKKDILDNFKSEQALIMVSRFLNSEREEGVCGYDGLKDEEKSGLDHFRAECKKLESLNLQDVLTTLEHIDTLDISCVEQWLLFLLCLQTLEKTAQKDLFSIFQTLFSSSNPEITPPIPYIPVLSTAGSGKVKNVQAYIYPETVDERFVEEMVCFLESFPSALPSKAVVASAAQSPIPVVQCETLDIFVQMISDHISKSFSSPSEISVAIDVNAHKCIVASGAAADSYENFSAKPLVFDKLLDIYTSLLKTAPAVRALLNPVAASCPKHIDTLSATLAPEVTFVFSNDNAPNSVQDEATEKRNIVVTSSLSTVSPLTFVSAQPQPLLQPLPTSSPLDVILAGVAGVKALLLAPNKHLASKLKAYL